MIRFLKRIALRFFSSTAYGTVAIYAFIFALFYGAINIILFIIAGIWATTEILIYFETNHYDDVIYYVWQLIWAALTIIATFCSLIPLYMIELMNKPVYETVNWKRDGF